MIKLLAIDLDGTLFNSKQQVSEKNRWAIEQSTQAGISTIIATGRGQRGVEMGLKRLDMDLPHICSAGALIRDGVRGKILSARTFHEMDELCHVLDFVRKHSLGIVADAPEECLWYGPDSLSESLDPLTVESGLESRTFNPENDFDQPLLKATMVVPSPLLAVAEKMIRSRCPSLQFTLAGDRYIDITARGVDKGSALAIYAELKGFKAAEIAAVGDHMIDIPMLKMAGVSAAMANAHPAVKEAAEMIVPSNDEDGVAWFIKTLLP